MHFPSTGTIIACLIAGASAAVTKYPTFTPLFNISLALGPSTPDISTPSGLYTAFSITGGSISGPALNGTVKSGLAIDQTLSNGSVTRENIQWFGTVGNTSIIAQGQGLVGPLFRELQSLTLFIGPGPLQYLSDVYILCSTSSDNVTDAEIQCYQPIIDGPVQE